jgi:GWxTD domain-containing protein
MALAWAGVDVHSQASGALPEDWFDADEWHLHVRYLLTLNELAAYRAVATEKQRSDFVDRFWNRRDPNPRTARNEFRDEFEQRVEFANQHFADPALAPHPGFETDRGRVYVLFGSPARIEPATDGSRETWHYAAATPGGAALSFEFVVPPAQSCDGGYRITSPPQRLFRGTSDVVRVYPQRFVTIQMPVDFTQASIVRHQLTWEDGRAFEEPDSPIFGPGQLGPAGADPLSLHFLACRMFGTGGMGYTHQLPSGAYRFTSTIQWMDGRSSSDAVVFRVP